MTNLNLKKNKYVPLILLFILTACESNTTYHSYLHPSDKGWGKKDTLTFKVPIKDSLDTYSVDVEVRNRADYPYCNLFLFVSHNTKDSTVFVTDTIEYALADKTGSWTGTGWGSLHQSSSHYTFITPKRKGNIIIKVAHGMREEVLDGISDIGIKITKRQ